MVKRFRVDGIPHLAFIGSNQEVKTALVGSVPKTILKDQMLALIQVNDKFSTCITQLLLNIYVLGYIYPPATFSSSIMLHLIS